MKRAVVIVTIVFTILIFNLVQARNQHDNAAASEPTTAPITETVPLIDTAAGEGLFYLGISDPAVMP